MRVDDDRWRSCGTGLWRHALAMQWRTQVQVAVLFCCEMAVLLDLTKILEVRRTKIWRTNREVPDTRQ